ncbi:MAG: hypothetical protein ABW189_02170 [Rickettsiales bacterium]
MAYFGRVGCAIVGLALSSCAADPKQVDAVIYGNETELTCRQLTNEMDKTLSYLREADRYDRFQWRYMFPPTGAASVYNIVTAKKKAVRRKEYLEEVMRRKQCYGGPQFSSFIEDGALSPTFNQAGLNRASGSFRNNYDVNFHGMRFERQGSDQKGTFQGTMNAVPYDPERTEQGNEQSMTSLFAE